MPTDEELMQMALSALITAELEGNCEYGVTDALRARLSQPEPVHANDTSQERVQKTEKNEHEPVAWMYLVGEFKHVHNNRIDDCYSLDGGETRIKGIPLYTAPPQREQGCAGCNKKASDGWALYCVKCSEPLREWVGLTDEEIGDIIEASKITLKNYCSEDKQTEFARAIEAKLRGKNYDKR